MSPRDLVEQDFGGGGTGLEDGGGTETCVCLEAVFQELRRGGGAVRRARLEGRPHRLGPHVVEEPRGPGSHGGFYPPDVGPI